VDRGKTANIRAREGGIGTDPIHQSWLFRRRESADLVFELEQLQLARQTEQDHAQRRCCSTSMGQTLGPSLPTTHPPAQRSVAMPLILARSTAAGRQVRLA